MPKKCLLVQETTKCVESSDVIIMLKLGGGVNLDNYHSVFSALDTS